jgi:hypothetical protein
MQSKWIDLNALHLIGKISEDMAWVLLAKEMCLGNLGY